jgi:hypothetical protein
MIFQHGNQHSITGCHESPKKEYRNDGCQSGIMIGRFLLFHEKDFQWINVIHLSSK